MLLEYCMKELGERLAGGYRVVRGRSQSLLYLPLPALPLLAPVMGCEPPYLVDPLMQRQDGVLMSSESLATPNSSFALSGGRPY